MNKVDECRRIIDFLKLCKHKAQLVSNQVPVAMVDLGHLSAAIALIEHLHFLNKAEDEKRLFLTPFARGQTIWVNDAEPCMECVVDSCNVYDRTFLFKVIGSNAAASWSYDMVNIKAFADKATAEYHARTQ